MAAHRELLQMEALTADKMEARMAAVRRAALQTEALMVVKTVCRVCPEIGADSPVGMAITSPAILPVIMAWECPQ